MIGAESAAQDWMPFCDSIREYAGDVMGARQGGISLQETLKSTQTNPAIADLGVEIVLDAYAYPKFSTENYQQSMIDEFANRTHIDCIKAFTAEEMLK